MLKELRRDGVRLRIYRYDPLSSPPSTTAEATYVKPPSDAVPTRSRSRSIARRECVVFVGPAGVGKSPLAQALGHEACRRGYDVLFMPAARALAQLAAGRTDDTYATSPTCNQCFELATAQIPDYLGSRAVQGLPIRVAGIHHPYVSPQER